MEMTTGSLHVLPRERKILLLLRLEIMSGRQQLVGIYRYMKLHSKRWNTILSDVQENHMDTTQIDGIICSESLIGTLCTRIPSDIPVVTLNTPPEFTANRTRNTVSIDVDNHAIGRMAAQHVFGQGLLRSAAFIPDPDNRRWSQQRSTAFRSEALMRGVPFYPFPENGNVPHVMRGWLQSLPKPCAVMVSYDAYAVQVLEMIKSCEIQIPEQMQVVSVDNDGLYCDYTQPTLSSVDPDFETAGFMAASELDALLRIRRHRANRHYLLPPKQLVVRESTHFLQPAAALVNRALAFIRDNATRGISATDVAMALGVSRRLLDLRFNQFLSATINMEIRRTQIERLCKLLVETRMSIDKVTATCGFTNSKYAKRLFKKATRFTMSAYRKRNHQES